MPDSSKKTPEPIQEDTLSLIQMFRYNADEQTEITLDPNTDALPDETPGQITWLNINSTNATSLIKEIGKKYGIHHLIVEDMMNTRQRPKVEKYEDNFYITLRMLTPIKQHEPPNTQNPLDNVDTHTDEQLSIFFKDGLIITVQEHPDDVFHSIRDRIRHGKGRVRKRQGDYLVYALLDAIIDEYLVYIKKFEFRTEALEEHLLDEQTPTRIKDFYAFRKELHQLKNMARSTREMLKRLSEEEEEDSHFKQSTKVYLRDVQDHVQWFLDIIEELREQINGMLELHFSQTNEHMSSIMKILAMISTIFIPLNLIAAIYGMNFKFMPELEIKGAYFVILAFMFILAGGMLAFFRRKRWL